MCFLQVFADFLSCVVNFWPGDDFLGGSSAETSIFPYNFLERQSCRDPYLSIRISRRGYLAYALLRPPRAARRRDGCRGGDCVIVCVCVYCVWGNAGNAGDAGTRGVH